MLQILTLKVILTVNVTETNAKGNTNLKYYKIKAQCNKHLNVNVTRYDFNAKCN